MKRYFLSMPIPIKAGIAAVFLLSLFLGASIFFQEKKEADITYVAPEKPPINKSSPFENISLSAKAALVYDMRDERVIYAKNADVVLPLASLTKVMTALAARENLKKDEILYATKEVLPFGSQEPASWKLSELLKLTLVESSNQAALAIGSRLSATLRKDGKDSIDSMNELAQKLGLSETFYINPTGLDSAELVAGGYGTLSDYEKLFAYALKKYPDLFEPTTLSTTTVSSLSEEFPIHNTNEIVNLLPPTLASKTGFTDLAGGNLIVVVDIGPNRPIFIGVLGSSKEDRFTDVVALSRKTLEYVDLE